MQAVIKDLLVQDYPSDCYSVLIQYVNLNNISL